VRSAAFALRNKKRLRMIIVCKIWLYKGLRKQDFDVTMCIKFSYYVLRGVPDAEVLWLAFSAVVCGRSETIL
jgi:hypothetical protein